MWQKRGWETVRFQSRVEIDGTDHPISTLLKAFKKLGQHLAAEALAAC